MKRLDEFLEYSMIRIETYKPEYHSIWDQFISNSKNGVFFFYRDYMEYHSDRFEDHSLLFFKNEKLVAVMPANIKNGSLNSHDGLTFGGVISKRNMKMYLMLKIFHELKDYLKAKDITKVFYKAIPHIYHSYPAEEDLYALIRNKAKLMRRDVSSAIFMDERIRFSKSRRRNIKKSNKHGLEIKKSHDYETFMNILEKNLFEKYKVKPTHSAAEIDLLASKFPDNIKLFTAEINDEIYSGVIIYASKHVAHAQYSASTEAGLNFHTNDLIYNFLINNYYKDKKYFNFGISTEKNGLYLNKSLIDYKERFGARAVVHDFYEWEI